MHVYAAVRIEGVPEGRFPVLAQLIRYPQGGVRIAKIGLAFRPGTPESREQLGTIGVDSASVVAVDAGVFERHWKQIGPERRSEERRVGTEGKARVVAEQ